MTDPLYELSWATNLWAFWRRERFRAESPEVAIQKAEIIAEKVSKRERDARHFKLRPLGPVLWHKRNNESKPI